MSYPQMHSTQSSESSVYGLTIRNLNSDEAQTSRSGQVAGYRCTPEQQTTTNLDKLRKCQDELATLREKIQDRKIKSGTFTNLLSSSVYAKDDAKSGSKRETLAKLNKAIVENKAQIQTIKEQKRLTPSTSTGYTRSSVSSQSFNTKSTALLPSSNQWRIQDHDTLEGKVQRLTKDRETLTQRLEYAQTELNNTRARAEETEANLNNKILALNNEKVELMTQAGPKGPTGNEMEQEIQFRVQQACLGVEEHIKRLEARVEKQGDHSIMLERDNQDKTREINALIEDRSVLSQELETAESKYKALESHYSETLDKQEEVRGSLCEKNNTLQKKLDIVDEQNKYLSVAQNLAVEKNQQIKMQLLNLQDSLKESETHSNNETQKHKDEVNKLNSKLDEANNKAIEMENKFQTKLQELEKSLQNKDLEIAELNSLLA